MKKRLIAIATALLMLFGVSVLAAGPAAAGTCTVVTSSWHLCGTVKAKGSCGVKISNGWPASYGTIRTLYNNQSSTRYFRDTDAYMVPKKCKSGVFQKKGVWIKIRDGQNIVVVSNK